MSKKKKYRNPDTRRDIEERQQKREIINANKGIVEEEPIISDEPVVEEKTEVIEKEPDTLKKAPKWYVLDTNLILSCVDVLYDPNDDDWMEPLNFKPSLTNAHLIIPYVVREELNRIANEEGMSFRKLAARTALRRLLNFFPNTGRELREIMNLSNPVQIGHKNQTISLLPLHRNFEKSLPWMPEKNDNDVWIAVTALAATMIREGLPVDGTVSKDEILKRKNDQADVILLTRDKNLLSKANDYAVRSHPYRFTKRQPFTGCRELEVSANMFSIISQDEKLSREEFEKFLPKEPPLIANEYVIIWPPNHHFPETYFETYKPYAYVMRYHKENDMLFPLRFMQYEGVTPPNARIAAYFDAMNDDRITITIVSGPPGTGKTFQAARHIVKEVRSGKRRRGILITTGNTKNDLGALPGGMSQKMEPLVGAIKNAIASDLENTPEFRKMREQLSKFGISGGTFSVKIGDDEVVIGDTSNERRNSGKKKKKKKEPASYNNLDYENDVYFADDFDEPHARNKQPKDNSQNRGMEKLTYNQILKKSTDDIFNRFFECYPYTQVEGRSFRDAAIIIDEIQRIHDPDDLLTMITRTAKNSKLYVCGDTGQIHDSTPEKLLRNGVTFARARFFDWEGCANIHLTDQMRNEIASFETEDYTKAYRRLGAF